jgi:magnesium transporter
MVTILAVRGESDQAVAVPVAELAAVLADPEARVWVDLGGAMDETAMHIVRDVFRFHPLAIEECFGTRAHPKIDEYDGYVYIITHGLAPGSSPEQTETIELDAFVGPRFLVTYHHQPSRSVTAVEDLLRRGSEPLRRGPAALLHAILDRQAQGIEPVIDGIDERIAELEDRAVGRANPGDLTVLMALRRNILQLRRWMSRQRDVVLRLSRGELPVGGAQEGLQFRDVYDQLQRFTDLLENYRELTISIQEVALTVTNNRLNETMKFLTVFTAVLMPLTVITGIYGMNFQHLPELRWKWGYPLVLGIMLVTSLSVLWFFRRRGWLGRQAPDLAAPAAPARDTIEER